MAPNCRHASPDTSSSGGKLGNLSGMSDAGPIRRFRVARIHGPHGTSRAAHINAGARGVKGRLLRRLEIENPALAALDQRAQMIMPRRQRGADLVAVAAPVIDTRRAGLVVGLVIQNLFDDMRLHADVGHFRGDGSSNIAKLPSGDARTLIETAR